MLTAEEIKNIIQNDKNSEKKRLARVGMKYYNGEHDIRHYRLFYYNTDGKLVEDKTRANFKIAHPFFTELVDQCVQYSLSGGKIVSSDNENLQKELDLYFADDFVSELSDVLTDACSEGCGYMYAYMSQNKRTKFSYADGLGVVEVMGKDTDDSCDYVVYYYTDRIDKGKKKIIRIQVWDNKKVYYYVSVSEGEIQLDESRKINPCPHIVSRNTDTEDKFGSSFGYIPFFRLDANRRQISHLKPIKALIDDYDLIACGLTNNIQDVADAVYVVKGFEGDNLDELQRNIKTKKLLGVTEGGGVEVLTAEIPVEARKTKLELDEKNIYRFGMGLNTAGLKDTAATTNIAIKAAYSLLDIKFNKLKKRLQAFMSKLVSVALDEINAKNDTAYTLADVEIKFKPEIMSNASDNAQIEKTEAETVQIKVNTLLNAASQMGEESVLKELCSLLDLDYSEVKRNSEKFGDEYYWNTAGSDSI